MNNRGIDTFKFLLRMSSIGFYSLYSLLGTRQVAVIVRFEATGHSKQLSHFVNWLVGHPFRAIQHRTSCVERIEIHRTGPSQVEPQKS